MIFQPEFETLERHALEALQLERVQALVERLRDANDVYRERLRGVAAPASLAEVGGLPFSTKGDMRDAYPLGLLAVPESELIRIHASSGTTGIGRVLNISSTGAFLATTAHLRPLSVVYLEPAGATFWEIQSRRIAASVVRQDASGVGLEWCEAAAETTKVVTRLTSLAGDIAKEERSPLHEQAR